MQHYSRQQIDEYQREAAEDLGYFDPPEPIDPLNITQFDRTREELEHFYIFCVVVAGKNSDWASRTVGNLLRRKPQGQSPLEYLQAQGHALRNTLVANRVGQYDRITRAITGAYGLDLATCRVEDLEAIHGVGPKTARFFLLHTRRDAECAALDTHILKYLRDKNLGIEIPEATPQTSKRYAELERLFVQFAKLDFPQLSLAEADLLIWTRYSGRLENDLPFADKLFPGTPENV